MPLRATARWKRRKRRPAARRASGAVDASRERHAAGQPAGIRTSRANLRFMRAVIQSAYGNPADVLRVADIPDPVPGPREAVVRVRAASVHADVWHVVTGTPRVLRLMGAGRARPKNPVPGTDLAGTVESVGAEVTRFKPGDAVFGETIAGMQWNNGGAWAERCAVPADHLALVPD